MRVKVELTAIQVLELIIVGIKNENYDAAINIAQDCVDALKAKEEGKNEVVDPSKEG